nr:unnamed protein product [Digitaria exilis]
MQDMGRRHAQSSFNQTECPCHRRQWSRRQRHPQAALHPLAIRGSRSPPRSALPAGCRPQPAAPSPPHPHHPRSAAAARRSLSSPAMEPSPQRPRTGNPNPVTTAPKSERGTRSRSGGEEDPPQLEEHESSEGRRGERSLSSTETGEGEQQQNREGNTAASRSSKPAAMEPSPDNPEPETITHSSPAVYHHPPKLDKHEWSEERRESC